LFYSASPGPGGCLNHPDHLTFIDTSNKYDKVAIQNGSELWISIDWNAWLNVDSSVFLND
jgi:hypothetical protein